MNIIWKDIEGYEGVYKVNNIGDVKSLARTRKGRANGVVDVKETILSSKISAGYRQVVLYRNAIRNMQLVHRLVCSAFHNNSQHLPQVNHKDGNKLNNNSDNLEWVTRSQNQLHAYSTGLQKHQFGSARYCAKLNEDKVTKIKQMLRNGARAKDIAKEYNVDPVTISNIKTGATWKRVL